MKESLYANYIIPYQELLGNYDANLQNQIDALIIPYQELLGNYDCRSVQGSRAAIIPYQELLGNYDQYLQIVCLW